MTTVPAVEVVHPGLVMDCYTPQGNIVVAGVVEYVVWDGVKPVSVVLKTPVGFVTVPLKDVKIEKNWTVH